MANRIRLAAAICAFAFSSATLADNVRGAWSPPFNWPLIAAHMILTPDGRILSYGTDGNGTQTGFFIYDVWDPNAGTTGGGHLTMPNISGTDIFCSSQVIMALSGDIFIAGGDNYVNGGTTNTGNNNSNVFSSGDQLAGARQQPQPAALVLHFHHAVEWRDLRAGRLGRWRSSGNP